MQELPVAAQGTQSVEIACWVREVFDHSTPVLDVILLGHYWPANECVDIMPHAMGYVLCFCEYYKTSESYSVQT